LHREVTKASRPPVRVTLPVTLSSAAFNDSPDMEIYAQAVAAELGARFHRQHTTLYSSDLQVTAVPPPCFESRQGCGGSMAWRFQLRTNRSLDAQVVGVAAGRGQLQARIVDEVQAAKCSHQMGVSESASVSEPLVPRSFPGPGCLSLGPVVHDLVGASAMERPEYSATVPSTVQITPTSTDAAVLLDWAQAHPAAELAITLDGWIIARIPAHTVIDAGDAAARTEKVGSTEPIELTSVGVHQPMDGAVALAINSAGAQSPLFADPPGS
jgi:hypothetical protein